jgi:hypothetical protein
MRAATSGDINAAIPKSLAKRALAAGLIKEEDMGMAPIARMAMKDAVDAYDAQPAPEQTTAARLAEEEFFNAGLDESLTAARLAEEEFDFNARLDESLTAARLAEEEFDFNAGLTPLALQKRNLTLTLTKASQSLTPLAMQKK